MFSDGNIYFTTATIYRWLPLLQEDKYKDILISSLKFLTDHNRLYVFAYVIMSNHLHIIWSEKTSSTKESAKASFFKYTSRQFLNKLKGEEPGFLQKFLVNKKDRMHQFWKRNSLDIEIFSEKIFEQKMNYIHNNPLQSQWQLVDDAVDYSYSSAKFYEEGIDEFGILTSYYSV